MKSASSSRSRSSAVIASEAKQSESQERREMPDCRRNTVIASEAKQSESQERPTIPKRPHAHMTIGAALRAATRLAACGKSRDCRVARELATRNDENRPVFHVMARRPTGRHGHLTPSDAFCHRLLAVACAVLIACAAFAAHGDAQLSPAARKAETRRAIQSLKATVDMSKATEKPRLGKNKDGSLMFFGAPPGAPAKVDDALANAAPEQKAIGFLKQHAAAFGIQSPNVDFQVKRVKSGRGRTFVRLQQTYAGIPVFGGETIVQIEGDGQIGAVISDIMPDSNSSDNAGLAASPVVDSDVAQSAAIDAVVDRYGVGSTPGPVSNEVREEFRNSLVPTIDTLLVYDPVILGLNGVPCLAWKLSVESKTHALEKYAVIVDARSGSVLLMYPLVLSLCDPQDPNLHRQVLDSNNVTDDPGDSDDDPVLVREEGDPPTWDSANPYTQGAEVVDADLAYEYFDDVYTFYCTHHDRDSIDDAGMPLIGVVRSCPTSLLPQPCPWHNASWDSELQRMLFGDGYVVDDVCAHELTHGVTQHTSDLLYFGESGAIAESLSDVWGEFVDQTNGAGNDTAAVRWQFVESIGDCHLFWRCSNRIMISCGPNRAYARLSRRRSNAIRPSRLAAA